MSRFGGGLAEGGNLVAAAEDAARQALAPLQGRRPDLACVFGSGTDPDEVASALQRAAVVTGAGTTLGCSAGGVIGGARGVELSPAVSAWAGVLPGVRVRGFHLDVVRTSDSISVVGMPRRQDDDEVGILLADPWSFPVDGFVEQSNVVLPGLPLAGGLATGTGEAGTTRLLLDGTVHGRGAVGALLGGPVGAKAVVSQGCRPVGPAMTVTAAEGNALLGLAGEAATAKLAAVLSTLAPHEQALVRRGLHLGIAMDEYHDEYRRGDFLIRGILGAEPDRGALLVGDLVEVGRTVRFQVRDADSAEEDLAGVLAGLSATQAAGPLEGALLFSCNGRGTALFPSADHDPQAVAAALHTAGVAGFFAAGEIGPVGGRNHLHGFTASLLAFSAAVLEGRVDVPPTP